MYSMWLSSLLEWYRKNVFYLSKNIWIQHKDEKMPMSRRASLWYWVSMYKLFQAKTLELRYKNLWGVSSRFSLFWESNEMHYLSSSCAYLERAIMYGMSYRSYSWYCFKNLQKLPSWICFWALNNKMRLSERYIFDRIKMCWMQSTKLLG